jgi:hypothetical protein
MLTQQFVRVENLRLVRCGAWRPRVEAREFNRLNSEAGSAASGLQVKGLSIYVSNNMGTVSLG